MSDAPEGKQIFEALTHVSIHITAIVKVTDLGAENDENGIMKQEVVGLRFHPPDVFSGQALLPPEVVLSIPLVALRAALAEVEKWMATRIEEPDPTGGATQPPGAA